EFNCRVSSHTELSYVPGILYSPKELYFPAKSKQNPNIIHGIYLTGTSAGYRLSKHVKYIKQQRLNAIVYDIKDVIGFVNYQSKLKDVQLTQGNIQPPISSLKKFHKKMLAKRIFRIARVALFQDERLAKAKPHLRILKKDKTPLSVRGHVVWVDPGLKETQDYNLNLIWEVLQNNPDEVQLDYVRYPAEGDWKHAFYANIQSYHEKPIVLTKFLQQVYSLAQAYNTYLSLDVFGVVAWQEKVDIKSTGQDLRLLSQAADIISPMLYPSHFGLVFGGKDNPADHPEYFIAEGCKKTKQVARKGIIVRPWLQAFAWRVTNYNAQYIEKQILGAFKEGAYGFLLWNAKNKYPYFYIPKLPKEAKLLKKSNDKNVFIPSSLDAG
ncbi:MAG: hypothetical protein D6767_06835, partial [Candidatus Hydrogenedentota bacterium]